LDEYIKFSSLKILFENGLIERCSGVHQSWRAEKARDEQLMKQRKSDTIAAGGAAFGRIQNGIMKWFAEQAVAQYPCVYRSRIHAKTDGFAPGP